MTHLAITAMLFMTHIVRHFLLWLTLPDLRWCDSPCQTCSVMTHLARAAMWLTLSDLPWYDSPCQTCPVVTHLVKSALLWLTMSDPSCCDSPCQTCPVVTHLVRPALFIHCPFDAVQTGIHLIPSHPLWCRVWHIHAFSHNADHLMNITEINLQIIMIKTILLY